MTVRARVRAWYFDGRWSFTRNDVCMYGCLVGTALWGILGYLAS